MDSTINFKNISTKGYTSSGLTNAYLAWRALNTYCYDCSEVTSRGNLHESGYFIIGCTSGIQLKVYPRNGQHPNIVAVDSY